MKSSLLPLAVLVCLDAHLSLAQLIRPTKSTGNYEVCYQWNVPKFQYPDGVTEEGLKKSGKLIERNVFISAVTAYKDRLFLTTPRYRPGVPATLSTIPYNREEGQNCTTNGTATTPLLQPFPSYEMNQEKNCSHLIQVQATRLDEYGRLWVADAGRTNLLTLFPDNQCPAKLVVFDLNNGDQIVHTYEFPPSVVPKTFNIIKDLQVACRSEDDCSVIVADIERSLLVIYDLQTNQSWTKEHFTMVAQLGYAGFVINGVPTLVPFGVNGIILSPKSTNYEYFYYTPIGSASLFRVNTSVLTDPANKEVKVLKNSDVTDLGRKISQTDGFTVDDNSNMYFGSLTESSVYRTALPTGNSARGTLSKAEYYPLVTGNTKEFLWPDVFSFDDKGGLLLTTTKFHIYIFTGTNANTVNYRIVLFNTGGKAYNA